MRDKITILPCLPVVHCLADSLYAHPSLFSSSLPFFSLLLSLRVTAHTVASLTFRVEAPGLFHLCNGTHIVVTYTRLKPRRRGIFDSESRESTASATERERKMRPAALFVACKTYVASTPRCFLPTFPAKCHLTWPA